MTAPSLAESSRSQSPVDPHRRSELAAIHLHAASNQHIPTTEPVHEALAHLGYLCSWLIRHDPTDKSWTAFVSRSLHDSDGLTLLLEASTPDPSLLTALIRSSRLRTQAHQLLATARPNVQAQLASLLIQAGTPLPRPWDCLLKLATGDADNPLGFLYRPSARDLSSAFSHLARDQPPPDHVWDQLQAVINQPDHLMTNAAVETLAQLVKYRPPPDRILGWLWDLLCNYFPRDSRFDSPNHAIPALGWLARHYPVPEWVWDRLLTEESPRGLDGYQKTSEALESVARYRPVPDWVWSQILQSTENTSIRIFVQGEYVGLSDDGRLGRLARSRPAPNWLWEQLWERTTHPDPQIHEPANTTLRWLTWHPSSRRQTKNSHWARPWQLTTHPDPQVRGAATRTLRWMAKDNSPPTWLWEQLWERITYPEPQVQVSATSALRWLVRHQEPPEWIWHQLLDRAYHPDAQIGETAASALRWLARHRQPPARLWHPLVQHATNPDAPTRVAAIAALGWLASRHLAPYWIWDRLEECSQDPDPDVHGPASSALEWLSKQQPTPDLIWERFQERIDHPDSHVRQGVCKTITRYALHQIPDQVWDRMLELKADPDADVRRTAVLACNRAGKWRGEPWAKSTGGTQTSC